MENQKTVSRWARETFGDAPNAGRIVYRARDEFGELIEAVHGNASPREIALEIADVFIVLYQAMEKLGFDTDELVTEKMTINRARTWANNGDGTAQHIKSSE